MAQNFRLKDLGLINREKRIKFQFNSENYYGYEGDT